MRSNSVTRGGIYLSDINIGTKMRTLDVGQRQAAYTGVVVHSGQSADGEELVYSVGDDTGSVLDVNVPNGSYSLACALLDKLKLRGYRYQPFEADDAIADPAIEIGDNITANNVPGIVMGIQTSHSRLMASKLKAPFDEEVNHEWKYVPRSERQFQRESAYTRSRLTINDDRIEAKVSKTGGNSQSFGWSLTDSSWTLTSNNSTVLRATSSGIEIMGRITATSGYIGNGSSGFEIGNNYIRNGMASLTDTTHNGVYIGTNGIALGAGNFKVDSSGNLTANSGTFRGNVSAGNIQYGGNYGTFNADGLTNYTIGSTKYAGGSVGESAIGGGAVTNGKIGNSAVSYGKVDFTSTLDQVGVNANNIAALQRGYFGALACTSLVIGDWQIVIESGGRVYAVSVN